MKSPDDAKRLIAVLDNEIAHLSSVFSTYARLYRGDKDVRALLSESDGAFFSDLYIVYLHYISVSVSRLLDPAATGKKANLTIAAVISILRFHNYPGAIDFEKRLDRIRKEAYNFVDPRNQLVSHLDLVANDITPGQRAIPSFTKSEFEAFYKELGILMNDIRQALGMIPNMYEWGIMGHGCGRKLLHLLKSAQEHINNKIERDDGGNSAALRASP
jgi:hypothetical protein